MASPSKITLSKITLLLGVISSSEDSAPFPVPKVSVGFPGVGHHGFPEPPPHGLPWVSETQGH
ncbi:MAG: hypothetical protein QXX37_08025, partial [Ignisphaera sp.]